MNMKSQGEPSATYYSHAYVLVIQV